MEAALAQYLDGDASDRALLLRRLDRVGQDLAVLERDRTCLSHAFGVFLQVWLAHTPPIDAGMKPDSRADARERYGASSKTLPRRL